MNFGTYKVGRPPTPFEDMQQHPTTGRFWHAGRWRTREGIERLRLTHRVRDAGYRKAKR